MSEEEKKYIVEYDKYLTSGDAVWFNRKRDVIMCLAIPLKLVEINGKDAIGEALGMRRSVRVDFIPDPKPGDFVMVHAGFAIERLPREQAEEDLSAWKELADVLG